MAEHDESSSAKWSAEAYNFLRLFRRVGTQIDGLLMLQVGWVILLWLVTKLSPGDGPYEIGLPKVVCADSGCSLLFVQVAVTNFYALGAVLILFIWLFTSRLYLFVTLPLLLLIRKAVVLSIMAIYITLLLLSLPISLIHILIKKYRVNRQMKVSTSSNENVSNDIGAKENSGSSVKEVDHWVLQEKIGKLIGPLVARLIPQGAIGLASIHTFSFDEEFLAARVPLQLFAEAEAQLRGNLRHLSATVHPHVVVLPVGIRIKSPNQARILRRWLGLDALLWGTYTSTNPPRLWINIAAELVREEKTKRRDYSYVIGTSIEGTYQSAIVKQDSMIDAGITLALALRYATVARSEHTFLSLPREVDPFTLYRYSLKEATEEFIIDLLYGISGTIPWDSHEPRADKLAVIVALDWVKGQLQNYRSDLSRDNRISLMILRRVIDRCNRLAPGNPEGRYLEAIFEILDDNLKAATASIDSGWKCDTGRRFPDTYSWRH